MIKCIYNFYPHFIRVSIKHNKNKFEYESNRIVNKIECLTKG